MTHAQEQEYWIAPSAITISLNAMDSPDYILGSTAANSMIMCYMKDFNGVIGTYDNGHSYRRWMLSCYPTAFGDSGEKYVYVAIPRSSSATNAIVVFPSVEIDIYGCSYRQDGELEVVEQIGSEEYYYIYLQARISASVNGSARQWLTADGTPSDSCTIVWGSLSTDAAINALTAGVEELLRGMFSPVKFVNNEAVEVFDIDDIQAIRANFDFFSIGGITAFGKGSGQQSGGSGEGTAYFAELKDIVALAFGATDDGKTIVWNGSAWVKGTAGDKLTKAAIEAVLTGNITSHSHNYLSASDIEGKYADKDHDHGDTYIKEETDPVWTAWLEGETGKKLLALLAILSLEDNNKTLKIDADTYATGGLTAFGKGSGQQQTIVSWFNELKDVPTSPTNGMAWGYKDGQWQQIEVGSNGMTEAEAEVIAAALNELNARINAVSGKVGKANFKDLLDVVALAFGTDDDGKTIVWDGSEWVKGTAGDKITSDAVKTALGNYVSTFGTAKGAITLLSGQTANGSVNLAMVNNQLKATIVLADWAKAANKPSYTTSEVSEGTNKYFTDARAQSALSGHTGDTTVHITANERKAWNAKYDKPSGGIPNSDLANSKMTLWGNEVSLGGSTNGSIIIKNGTKSVTLSVDSDGSLKLDANVYATGGLSAFGKGTNEIVDNTARAAAAEAKTAADKAQTDATSALSQINSMIKIQKVSAMPSNPDANTLYIVV